MSNKFYGYANTTKGQQVLVPLTETVRHRAENELNALCVKEKLGYGGVHIVQGTQRQAGTLQKKFANGDPTPRKSGRGKR